MPAVKAPPEIGDGGLLRCDCNVVDVFPPIPGSRCRRSRSGSTRQEPVMKWLLELNFSRLDRTQQPLTPEYRLAWTSLTVLDAASRVARRLAVDRAGDLVLD